MSTQTKQQRQSGDVAAAAPSASELAAQVAAAASAPLESSASESPTREPNDTNNNNNKHEKQIIAPAGSKRNTHKRAEQKLTRGDSGGAKQFEADESTLRNSTTNLSESKANALVVVVGQSEQSSAARMGSVISNEVAEDQDDDLGEQSSSASATLPLRADVAVDGAALPSAMTPSDKQAATGGDSAGQRLGSAETTRRRRADGVVERTLHDASDDDVKRDNKHDQTQEAPPACHEQVSPAQIEPAQGNDQPSEKLRQIERAAQQTPADEQVGKLERTIVSTNNDQRRSRSLRSNEIKQVNSNNNNNNKWASNKLTPNNCHHKLANQLEDNNDDNEAKELAHQLESGSAQFDANAFNHHHTAPAYFKPATPRRLSYIQSLLLRKWPCLALAICIMTSLLFGILLSGLTIYLMHGVDGGNCSELVARLEQSANGGGVGGIGSQHHLRHPAHHAAAASLLPHELVLTAAGPPALESGAADSSRAQLEPELSHRQMTSSSVVRPPDFQRLPNSVVPQHYELFIWPHIAEPSFQFNGKVEIYLTCRTPTDNITLHTLDLSIDDNSLQLTKLAPGQANGTTRLAAASSSSSRAPKVTRLSQDKQLQYSIVHLDSQLEAGQDYLLRMDFVGTLNDDLAGFYKIKYERQNSNETTWIAATQFQATDARRAFPCFDEPLYKATFGIRLKHWKNMTALSNMQIVSSEESPDGLWITDTFAKSQRMSTYLVAFAVTNFESRTNGNITVWTRPGLVHTAEYALSIADRILRHYEDFFGIAYPLPKMDMIALPDFNAGAMENWGLITYRETAMLYDENSSSVANKQRVAVVVAHELAHQWFGNLVTPKWWDDLWLNEGFASFVEYIGVDHVEPKWRMLDQFVVDEIQDVLKLDGLSSSHQISIPVNNPDEISEIFDHISYSKGASIIRMMNHFLTDPVFKAGLQRYLKALKYDNAEQSDLWSHLTTAQQMARQNSSNYNGQQLEAIDVSRVMNSWTLQTGYPLVTLTRDYANNTAQLDQVRYQPFKLQESNSGVAANQTVSQAKATEQQRWEVPITYTWKSEQNWQPVTRLWLHQNQTGPVELAERRLAANEWMLVNVQQVGYYRVNYDLRNWKLLIDQLREDHTKISTTNRAQLLDDIFELAKSSQIDYQLAMEATKYLKLESEYLPWESVLLSFGYIDEMLLRTSIYGDWQDYFAQLIAPYYERYRDLEWVKSTAASNSSAKSVVVNSTTSAAAAGTRRPVVEIGENDVLEHYNHVNAISWACAVNNQHCIDKAVAVFREWRRSGVNNIKPALRHRAYCTAIEFGTKDDWDFLWRVYEREQGASEKDRILRALGCSRELWILSRYLEWTFSKTKPIRRQDGAFVFRVVAKNNHGRDIAFNFMRERWPIIKEYYGKSSFSLGGLIKSVATSMNTQLELDQLKTFYESIKGDVGTGKRSFQIAIEEVESNVSWRNRNYKKLEDWLQRQRVQK